MLKVKIEEYHNDNRFNYFIERFSSLEDLGKWIIKQMTVTDLSKWIRFSYKYPYITAQPNGAGWSYHIHLIEDDDGIIFSDGQCTNGQSFVASCVSKWLDDFKAEIIKPKFNFVDK
jgi:hypothetical protein